MSLDIYVPEVRLLEVGGKSVAVAPLRVRQIPAFTRAIAPAIGPLLSGDIATALGAHGDDLVRAVSVATDQPADWLGDLEADDFLRLAAAVVEVNADFFVHRLTPAIEQASRTLGTTLGAIPGATPSPSFSPEESDGATAMS